MTQQSNDSRTSSWKEVGRVTKPNILYVHIHDYDIFISLYKFAVHKYLITILLMRQGRVLVHFVAGPRVSSFWTSDPLQPDEGLANCTLLRFPAGSPVWSLHHGDSLVAWVLAQTDIILYYDISSFAKSKTQQAATMIMVMVVCNGVEKEEDVMWGTWAEDGEWDSDGNGDEKQ